jgi:hypothetical protein
VLWGTRGNYTWYWVNRKWTRTKPTIKLPNLKQSIKCGGITYAINTSKQIYKLEGDKWVRITGALEKIYCKDNIFYGTNLGKTYYWINGKWTTKSPFDKPPPPPIETKSHNVKDWGAKGDGRTNDTNAIKACMNYWNSKGGGEVFLPAGTYIINNIIIRNNITFNGAGKDKTILKPPPGSEWGCTLESRGTIKEGKYATGQNVTYQSDGWKSGQNITVSNLTTDNTAAKKYGHGMRIVGSKNIKVINVKLIGAVQYGIGGIHNQDLLFQGVDIINSGGDSIDMKNNGAINRNFVFRNCTFRKGPRAVSSAPVDIRCPKFVMEGCKFYGLGLIVKGRNSQPFTSYQCVIKNCEFNGTGEGSSGIGLEGYESTVENCKFNGCEIGINTNADDCIIRNCKFTNSKKYAIEIDERGEGNDIIDCYLEGKEKSVKVRGDDNLFLRCTFKGSKDIKGKDNKVTDSGNEKQNDGYSENDDTPKRYAGHGGGNLGHASNCWGFHLLTEYNPKYKTCEQMGMERDISKDGEYCANKDNDYVCTYSQCCKPKAGGGGGGVDNKKYNQGYGPNCGGYHAYKKGTGGKTCEKRGMKPESNSKTCKYDSNNNCSYKECCRK